MVLLFELILLLVPIVAEFTVNLREFTLQNVDTVSRSIILVLVLFNLIFL